jgi:hypothetical protein
LVKEKEKLYQPGAQTFVDLDLETVSIREVFDGFASRQPLEDAIPDAADQETIDGIIVFFKTKLQ